LILSISLLSFFVKAIGRKKTTEIQLQHYFKHTQIVKYSLDIFRIHNKINGMPIYANICILAKL
jgi:hypothetical protein